MNITKTIILFFSIITFTINGISEVKAQVKTTFKETFENSKLKKNWKIINGTWEIKDSLLQGTSNREWAILLSKKSLPEDYILTFSALVEPKAYLFELMLNLHRKKFIGILYNQLDKDIAFEDRSFYTDIIKKGRYIETTVNVSRLPSVDNPKEYKWCNWKIQKSGNQIFVWINDEAIIRFDDLKCGILKSGGKFGFAINGKAEIKNITLFKTKKESVLPPVNFIPRTKKRTFFAFE